MPPPSRDPDETAPAASRGRVWLRALLLLPLLLAGFVAIDGRGLALDIEVLAGGDGAPSLHALRAVTGVAAVAYGSGGLLLYCLLILNPPAALRRRPDPLLALLLAVAVSFALIVGSDRLLQDEIGQAALAGETIAADAWQVERCARGSALCVDWSGRFGSARVKGPAGSSEQAAADLAAWRQAHAAGQPLEVIWGPTPAGWISVRSAGTGNLRLDNR